MPSRRCPEHVASAGRSVSCFCRHSAPCSCRTLPAWSAILRTARRALLALALLAYTDPLDDADRAVPEQLDEALERLTEARQDCATASFGVSLPLAAGLARWRRAALSGVDAVDRATLDLLIGDLTVAL